MLILKSDVIDKNKTKLRRWFYVYWNEKEAPNIQVYLKNIYYVHYDFDYIQLRLAHHLT